MKASTKTNISTKVIVEVGGICYLIVGINATNETMIAAMAEILLKISGSQKKTPKLVNDKISSGKNIVRFATTGFLYKGI